MKKHKLSTKHTFLGLDFGLGLTLGIGLLVVISATWGSITGTLTDQPDFTATPTINKVPIASVTGGKLALGWIPDLSGTYLPLHSTADLAINLSTAANLPSGTTAATQAAGTNNTTLATTAYADTNLLPKKTTVVPSSGTITPAVTASGSAFTFAAAGQVTLPAIGAGDVGVRFGVAKLTTGTITIQAPASTYINGSQVAGTLINSSTNQYDFVWIWAVSTTQWIIVAGNGPWQTN